MADIEIEALPAGTTGVAAKVFESQVNSPGGTSEKFTGQQIVDVVVGTYLPLAGGTMDAAGNINFPDDTGLVFGTTPVGSFFYASAGDELGFAIVGQQTQLAFQIAAGTANLHGDNGVEIATKVAGDIILDPVGVVTIPQADTGLEFEDGLGAVKGRLQFGSGQNAFSFTDDGGLRGFSINFNTNQMSMGNFTVGGEVILLTTDSDIILQPQGAGVTLFDGSTRMDANNEMTFWDLAGTTQKGRIYYDDGAAQFIVTNLAGTAGLQVTDAGEVSFSTLVAGQDVNNVSASGDVVLNPVAGAVRASSRQIKDVADGVDPQDVVSKAQLDTKIGAVIEDPAPSLGGDLNLNNHAITMTLTPTVDFVLEEWGVITAGGVVKSDASAAATSTGRAVMALGPITGGVSGTFAAFGQVAVSTVVEAPVYFLSEAVGQITTVRPTTPGAFVRLVGSGVKVGQLALASDQTVIGLA